MLNRLILAVGLSVGIGWIVTSWTPMVFMYVLLTGLVRRPWFLHFYFGFWAFFAILAFCLFAWPFTKHCRVWEHLERKAA